MNRKVLLLALFQLLAYQSIAQITFEKGYFLDNDAKKTECYIKNIEWKNNPSKFEYKLNLKDNNTLYAEINQIKEFVVEGQLKYIKANVLLDRSGAAESALSSKREPEFKRETLLLRVLIEGEAASLCHYEAGELRRFFYQLKDSTLKQLVFKYYKPLYLDKNSSQYVEDNYYIGTNNYFQQQLWQETNCEAKTMNWFAKIGYNKADLIDYFTKYNQCKKAVYENLYTKKYKKSIFIRIAPGFDAASFVVKNYTLQGLETEFKKKAIFRLGMELEYVLPFYKNKLSMILEPIYQQFEASAKANDPLFNNSVKYHFFEVPAGFRYYFYLNNNLRLFANGFLVVGFPQKTNLNYKGLGYNTNVTFTTSLSTFALGAGISYKRIGAECRYYTKRSVYYQGGINTGYYQKVSLVTSFRIY